MSFISDLFGGSSPSIMTQTVTDPSKQAVANPLSNYLTNQVGQGLPTFNAPSSPNAVNNFLDQSVDQIYNDYAAPATQQFTQDLLPVVREGYAGALSSSGRDNAETTAAGNFELSLAETKAGLETSVPEAQQSIYAQDYAQQYQTWYQGLAQNNPALGEALTFLNQSTSDGTNVLSALNPGTQGIIDPLISSAATLGAAALTGGASLGASSILAGALGEGSSMSTALSGNTASGINLNASGNETDSMFSNLSI